MECWFCHHVTIVIFSYNTAMRVECEALAQKWIEADDSKMPEFSESDCLDLTSPQVVEFLSILLNHKVRLYMVLRHSKIQN